MSRLELDNEDLDTIEACFRSGQAARVTTFEIGELVGVYRAALHSPEQIAKAAIYYDTIKTAKEQYGKDWWAAAEVERLQKAIAQDQRIARLQRVVARYGDRVRMSNAPADLQQEIDEAIASAEPTPC